MPFDFPTLTPTFILILCTSTLAGALVAYFFASRSTGRQNQQALEIQKQQWLQQQSLLEQQRDEHLDARHDAEQQLNAVREQLMSGQTRIGELTQSAKQVDSLREEKQQLQIRLDVILQEKSDLQARFEAQSARHGQERQTFEEKIVLLESAEKRLQEQFENLANRIFEQKQANFTQSSKQGLDAVLAPFKEQLEGFKRQVTDQYVKEGQERASLKTEILSLKSLNQKITEEAAALTKALKGDNKQQGNWGEVVLERILKESGLRDGHEFDMQVSLKNDSGKHYQPDVVVHLPNDKDVVIDSKVSLSAYERYFNAEDDDVERQSYLNEHVNSLKNHIKELGKKDYQDLQGLRSLDYVLMFVPIEPAFLLAVDQAPDLVKLALDNNIMLVSPTNLLVALRTINNIWQYEYQNQNAQKIAVSAGKLYDKFHGFVTDMEKIGRSLDTTQKAYDAALNKLSSGKGNLVKQVEDFRAMGVQTKKKLDQSLLDKAGVEDTDNQPGLPDSQDP